MFRRRIPRSSITTAQHVYAYDLTARKEQVLSNLDDMGTGSNAFAQNLASSFDLLELQAENDAINLIISTLSNMMSSNRNTASQASNNLE